MSSKASIYEEYKRAEREAFGELFRGQPYTSWPVKTFYAHLPPFLKPSVAVAVIKNLRKSLNLREKVTKFYAAASETQTYIRHEYFKQCLDHLIDAVRNLPPPPRKTKSGHNRYGVLRTQGLMGDDEPQGDESLEATKCTTQRREEQTPTTELDDTSLEDMDRLMFQDVVQTFILRAGENWQNAVRGKFRLSTASIISDVHATELQAILNAAELLDPSWFKSQDQYSWDLEDHKINGKCLVSSCCASGLPPSYLPVAIYQLMTSQRRADKLRCLVWKNIIHASSNAATETEVNRLRGFVKQELEETLDLCQRHRGLLEEDSHVIIETTSTLRVWAQSADILSIGKIAQVAEGYSVVVYRAVLELPSITMFAYLCEYVRIELHDEHKPTLPEPLESWFNDKRLSKLLWWNGRPHNLRDWETAVDNWVLPSLRGIAVAKGRHKLPLFQRISEDNYRCSIVPHRERRPLSEVLEEELNTPNTDSIRTCVLDTVGASLGDIGSEWGDADAMCALRLYQECREGEDPQSVLDAFIKRWEAGDAAGGRFADTVGLAQEISQGVAKEM
ncbi:hypothetical protein CLIM01_13476 [Colletotrichum limetticola]|uniref:Uncharacterized protein n=1 Tax=Colletotrichum limetticola TaxID=1209924 RepID=A0ABQ9PAM8_9PEZI|nr:hypothetical protein CLIM01_13476 [Colletotrichum limetticola]